MSNAISQCLEAIQQYYDINGPLVGATIKFYAGGGNIPKAVYYDYAKTLPTTSIVSNSSGYFPQYFLDSGDYRIELLSPAGQVILSRDHINQGGGAAADDYMVKVNSAGNPGYFYDKVQNTPTISWTVSGDRLQAQAQNILDYKVKADVGDSDPGYLSSKIVDSTSIHLEIIDHKIKATYVGVVGVPSSGGTFYGDTAFSGDVALGGLSDGDLILSGGVVRSVPSTTPNMVKHSENDAIAGYLGTKIKGGGNVVITTTTDDEDGTVMHISMLGNNIDAYKVASTSADGNPGYLSDKLVSLTPGYLQVSTSGGNTGLSILGAPITGPAGGDLYGTYPNPIVSQITGVGAALIDIATDFEWIYDQTHVSEDNWGGRGITPGRVYKNGVETNVWAAQETTGYIHYTTDNWVTSYDDYSLVTHIGGPQTATKQSPCLNFLYMGGAFNFNAWVCGIYPGGQGIYYAPHLPGSYNANGQILESAWQYLDTSYATTAIASHGNITCLCGDHQYIRRTTDWNTFTSVLEATGVIRGVATDRHGIWIAVTRDSSDIYMSIDDGINWTNPVIYANGVSVASLYNQIGQTFAVCSGNGTYLIVGSYGYASSIDGINWITTPATLNFAMVGFDGVRFYATNASTYEGTNTPAIWQLAVSHVPCHRHFVAEQGITIDKDTYLPYLPSSPILSTDEIGRVVSVPLPYIELKNLLSPPAITANRLYSVGGVLHYNGAQV